MGLLGRLRNWFGGGDRLDLFQPHERRIFTYWNGKEKVQADPMVLYKKIMEVGPSLGIDMKVAGSLSKDNIKAHHKMIATMRDIFSVAPFEQGGLLQDEVEDLFFQFMEFNDFLKKNSRQAATSVPETSAATPPSPAADQGTQSGSDSGSTANATSTVSPVPTPTVPA